MHSSDLLHCQQLLELELLELELLEKQSVGVNASRRWRHRKNGWDG